MSILEQLKRERTRAIVVAAVELTLGVLMVYIGLQFFNASEFFRFAIYEMEQNGYTPAYVLDLYKAILAASLAGGFFAIIHGVKRIIDNALNAWVKSAIPREPE